MESIKFRRAHYRDEAKNDFYGFTTWGVDVDHPGFKSPSHISNAVYVVDEQFIGLHDKNGNEIYESDVVRDEWGAYYYVVMEEGCFYGKYTNGDVDADINLYHKESIVEVIGNTHEKT